MVRLEPILSDPDEDRQHNKIGAAMLGVVLGGIIGFLCGWPLSSTSWLLTAGVVLASAAIVGLIGYWRGEEFTLFVAEWLKGGRWSIFRRDDWW